MWHLETNVSKKEEKMIMRTNVFLTVCVNWSLSNRCHYFLNSNSVHLYSSFLIAKQYSDNWGENLIGYYRGNNFV